MSREDHQMKIRIPDELKSRIEESAAKSGRSLNAEVVFRLERAYSEIEPEFKNAEQRFAEALAMQRYDSLQNQWRIERTRLEALRDRLDRLIRAEASKKDIGTAMQDILLAERDLEKLADSLTRAESELVKLARQSKP